jgi:hypothetical protein
VTSGRIFGILALSESLLAMIEKKGTQMRIPPRQPNRSSGLP